MTPAYALVLRKLTLERVLQPTPVDDERYNYHLTEISKAMSKGLTSASSDRRFFMVDDPGITREARYALARRIAHQLNREGWVTDTFGSDVIVDPVLTRRAHALPPLLRAAYLWYYSLSDGARFLLGFAGIVAAVLVLALIALALVNA